MLSSLTQYPKTIFQTTGYTHYFFQTVPCHSPPQLRARYPATLSSSLLLMIQMAPHVIQPLTKKKKKVYVSHKYRFQVFATLFFTLPLLTIISLPGRFRLNPLNSVQGWSGNLSSLARALRQRLSVPRPYFQVPSGQIYY